MAKLVSMLSSFILTVIMNNNISNSSVSGQRNLSQRDLPDTNYRAICITRCAIPRDAKWQSDAYCARQQEVKWINLIAKLYRDLVLP